MFFTATFDCAIRHRVHGFAMDVMLVTTAAMTVVGGPWMRVIRFPFASEMMALTAICWESFREQDGKLTDSGCCGEMAAFNQSGTPKKGQIARTKVLSAKVLSPWRSFKTISSL